MRLRDVSKEQSIRRKALEMFVRQGLDGFSMQKLARSARVSPATLYIYYKDRDDLIFQIFRRTIEEMFSVTLEGCDAEMSLAEGLKIQWRNRARYCLAHPLESEFLGQIHHSPYFQRFQSKLDPTFHQQMSRFMGNAIRRKEMVEMPRELLWSIVYAPLYQLIKYHQTGYGLPRRDRSTADKKFQLTNNLIDQGVHLVTKALKP